MTDLHAGEFVITPKVARNHFPAVALHEIAHAIGLPPVQEAGHLGHGGVE